MNGYYAYDISLFCIDMRFIILKLYDKFTANIDGISS